MISRDRIPASIMQQELNRILNDYPQASKQAFTRHPIRDVFRRIGDELRASSPVRKRPQLRVEWSMGQGNWAKVPWIALLDKRAAKSIQDGVYCVYLFREDMTGVYLTFNQGVTEPKKRGVRVGYEELRRRADSIRSTSRSLEARAFSLANDIDLRAKRGLGADYEVSTIAHKFYEAANVPPNHSCLTTSRPSCRHTIHTSRTFRPNPLLRLRDSRLQLALETRRIWSPPFALMPPLRILGSLKSTLCGC